MSSAAGLPRQPVAVLHQEARRAGELVGLLRNHPNRELFTREIRAGQFERVELVAVVDVDHCDRGVVAPARDCLERLFGDVVGFGLAWAS